VASLNELAEIAAEFPANLSLHEIYIRLGPPRSDHFYELGAQLQRWERGRQY
jgi:hypothetical protein